MRGNRFSQIMEQNLTVVYQSSQECMCGCPFCEGKSSLSFNDEKGLWICFRCGEKGTAKILVEMLEGTYAEPELELEQISSELRSLERDVQSVQKYLPEPYLRRFHQPGRVHELWRERGFERSASDLWELGYDFLTGRLSIPFRDPFTGRLAGIIFRTTDGSLPRYQYPKGFARSSSLYGSWHIPAADSRSVVLVEGPTDCIRVSQTGVLAAAQYGSSLSAGQVRLLHRLGCNTVSLFFDYDRAGLLATSKAEEALTDFSVEKAVWDADKYCWHRKICGCTQRGWGEGHNVNLSYCPRKKHCGCGRVHEPDPGDLKLKEIDDMLGRTTQT